MSIKRRARFVGFSTLLGLVGPLFSYIVILVGVESLAPIGTLLWPTWLIGWFAMGQTEVVGGFIMASTVVANVAFFMLLGWLISLLRINNTAVSIIAAVFLYGVLYFAVDVGITSFI